MSTRDPSLERECRALASYLIGRLPEPYVIEKYAEAHRRAAPYTSGDRFGRTLTRIARTHPALAKPADSYARLFAPRSLLRKKLVLLLAILETSAPSYRLIDEADAVPRPLLLLRIVGRGAASLLSLLAGVLVLLPLHLVFGLVGARD